MDFNQRLEELNKKRLSQGLNLDSERREFELLFNAAQEVARNPELQQARAERNRIIQEAVRQNILAHIKRTSVVRNGKRVILSDVESNDAILDSLLNPGEELTPDWFFQHFQEPAFDRLAWEPWLTPTQRKTQAEKTAQASRQQALAKCCEYGLSECESNLHILMNHDGVVTWVANGPTLMTDVVDEGEIPLVAATQAELQKYADEKRDKHQAYLRELRDKNDIPGLIAASARERAEKLQNQELTWKQKQMLDLVVQYERDSQAGYRSPLPQMYDAVAIRKFDAQKMREVMSRFGASRITARLYGLTEIPDGHGGMIYFE